LTFLSSEEFVGLSRKSKELLDELPEAPGVLHPILTATHLLRGEGSRDGLALDLAGPLPVGAVPFLRIVLAAAAR
jgi:hypothetical protein